MFHVSLEYILMLGYAIVLGMAALLLELAARHAHKRSLSVSTIGFTYHPERDVWRCPRDQHLFPVFSDPAKGTVTYRAPASACNRCISKAACTDSNNGREIERNIAGSLEFGMQRFHRAMSLTLLALASLILVIEIFRTGNFYPRAALAVVLIVSCITGIRLGAALFSSPAVPSNHQARPAMK